MPPVMSKESSRGQVHPIGQSSGSFPACVALSRQVIKDRNDRVLGYIETLASGRQKATDRDSRLLGWFDPERNITTDAADRTLAKANVLSGLIFDRR